MFQRAIDHLEPYQRAIAKAHLASAGISVSELDEKPIIAVVNSWSEVCPGHEPLQRLAVEAKAGIRSGGGVPIEFNTIGICDGISQGHKGMRYTLPHREIIADSIEAMILGHGIFDGMILLGSCDKIIPAMMQAAIRINIPSILVTAGPCDSPEVKPSDSDLIRRQYLSKKISERELIEETLKYYTGPGVCPFLGTANTMAILCEVMGLMLSGSSLLPAGGALRRMSVKKSGEVLMNMVKMGHRPRDIITTGSFYNAMVVLCALGGSLNACLHLPAIAAEMNIQLSWDRFAEVSAKTPLIAALPPNGNHTVQDLQIAGADPSILHELQPLLMLDEKTVENLTIGQIAQKALVGERTVIHPFSQPLAPNGGLRVFYGSLAPQGALFKASAVPNQQLFTGPAMVFDSEEDCRKALDDNRIHPGTVVIVRYEGPKGGPGMREMHRVTEVIKQVPNVALVTDGRFSGASAGLSIGYLCPEAAAGGPIALVENGDIITIDIEKGTIDLNVSQSELARRKEKWQPIPKDDITNMLKRYSERVESAASGGILI